MAALSLARTAAAGRWRLQRWLRLPGAGPVVVVLAFALALACALWFWNAGQRLQAARAVRQPDPATASTMTNGTSERRVLLQQFVDGLLMADEVPATVQSLLDLAEQQGLRLLRGSYRLQAEPAARFARYRMNLPVRGDPERVQRFIQAALLDWPSLSIESIQFKREDDSGHVLEARIQWVLFVRTDGGAAARPAAVPGPAARAVGS